MMRPGLSIGSRGYDYDKWEGVFYPVGLPPAKRLDFYAERCGTVLIQKTFRGLPEVDEVKFWEDSTPESFRFTFVAPAEIATTHQLAGPGAVAAVERFLDRVRPLQRRLGAIIHVVPRPMRLHVSRIDEFLASIPRDVQHTLEFSATEWFVDRTREALERRDAGFSIHDNPDCVAPWWVTADHVVIRRYGALGKGEGKYTSDEVVRVAHRIHEDVRPEKTVYLYFENDQQGFACEHALLARDLLVD